MLFLCKWKEKKLKKTELKQKYCLNYRLHVNCKYDQKKYIMSVYKYKLKRKKLSICDRSDI